MGRMRLSGSVWFQFSEQSLLLWVHPRHTRPRRVWATHIADSLLPRSPLQNLSLLSGSHISCSSVTRAQPKPSGGGRPLPAPPVSGRRALLEFLLQSLLPSAMRRCISQGNGQEKTELQERTLLSCWLHPSTGRHLQATHLYLLSRVWRKYF